MKIFKFILVILGAVILYNLIRHFFDTTDEVATAITILILVLGFLIYLLAHIFIYTKKGIIFIISLFHKPKIYKSLNAFAAAVESGEAKIDATIYTVIDELIGELQNLSDEVTSDKDLKRLEARIATLSKITAKKVKGKPSVASLADLADACEEGRAKVDRTLKIVLKTIYDDLEDLETDDENFCSNLTMVTYDLERIVFRTS